MPQCPRRCSSLPLSHGEGVRLPEQPRVSCERRPWLGGTLQVLARQVLGCRQQARWSHPSLTHSCGLSALLLGTLPSGMPTRRLQMQSMAGPTSVPQCPTRCYLPFSLALGPMRQCHAANDRFLCSERRKTKKNHDRGMQVASLIPSRLQPSTSPCIHYRTRIYTCNDTQARA